MLLHGDCLDRLKELPDKSIDSIVTDPPYGLSFMGKRWDYDVPSKEIWTECLRVLKPGGHLLSFGGTRTYHRLVVNIEDAGFEIRDQIQWLYGSGFPKSHNLKGEHQGFGTALKPANEPICVARKPLERGLTVAENVLKYGTGAINIDASRIGLSEEDKKSSHLNGNSCNQVSDQVGGEFLGAANTKDKQNSVGKLSLEKTKTLGRWPANLILDETAAEMLDEQSGKCRSAGNYPSDSIGTGNGTTYLPTKPQGNLYADSGGASRFFYVAKASKSERNRGLEGMPLVKAQSGMGGKMPRDDDGKDRDRFSVTQANHHPTVKPLKLMSYLIKLVTPPNGTVLDPFMGSGSTGVAAKELGFKFVGIEMNEEYLQIAEKRMEAAV